MKRINFFIDLTSLELLKGLPGTLSEHIRQAIRDYLRKTITVGASSSKRKRGE